MKFKIIILITIVISSLSFTDTDSLEIPKLRTVYEDSYKVGDRILAPIIYFGFDSNGILIDQCYDSILHLAQFLEKNQEFKFEIGIHSDSRGNADYNLRLTEYRAKTVQKYMEHEHQIDRLDISWKGFGETAQIISEANICCKEDKEKWESQHGKNRRVEVRILGKSKE